MLGVQFPPLPKIRRQKPIKVGNHSPVKAGGTKDDTPKEATDRTLSNRLTPDLAKEHWTAVPDVLLRHHGDMGLTPAEALFLIQILSYKWDKRKPYPGLKAIGTSMGVSYSTVRRYAERCRDLKVLKMDHRKGETCEYDLSPLFSQLEEKAKSDRKKRGK